MRSLKNRAKTKSGLFRDEMKPTKNWVKIEFAKTQKFTPADLTGREITRDEIFKRTNGDFKNIIIP